MKPLIDSSNYPTVSLVIPTHNRAESLARTLEAISRIEVPSAMCFEVVVVLDGCTDHSAAVLERAAEEFTFPVILAATAGIGAGGARNHGVKKSSGALIGFIDDDVIPEPSWLKQHNACHAKQREPIVSIGAMKLPTNSRLPPWNEWEVLSLRKRYQELSTGKASANSTDLYTANAMMPRDVLIAVGGFDEALKRAEDVELGSRLAKQGVDFVFVRDATVVHCPVRSLRSWKKIPVNYANSYHEMRKDDLEEQVKQLDSPKLANMHWLTKFAVKHVSKQAYSSAIYCFVAESIGRTANFLRLQKISYAAFSSVYNVLYFGTLHRNKLKVMDRTEQ